MTEPKLATFVAPELGRGRIDAQWARIAEHRPALRKRPSQTLPAAVIVVAACTIGMVWWPREPRSSNESVWEGSVVASDDSPVDMTLAEGTRIKVEPRSEVKLLRSSSEAVQVRLDRGSARFDVVKKRARRFSVDLGKVEVVVTGTQFRVLRRPGSTGERVRVEVEEGSVEVHRADGAVVILHAGDDWSTVIARDHGVVSSDAQGEVAADRGGANGDSEADGDSDRALTAGSGSDEPGQDEGALAADEVGDEIEEDEVDDGERPERRRGSNHSAVSLRRQARRARAELAETGNAGELFDHANLARRAGRLSDAAALYAELVTRYPRDRRASLAAFELGRLRMDSLRDTRGAVLALERALQLDSLGEFAEDALARLVLAQEARGDRSACGHARDRYLARYPEGVHAQHVAERCGP